MKKAPVQKKRPTPRRKTAQERQRDGDPFSIVGNVPDEWSYQWMAVSVYGDTGCVARSVDDMVGNHWTPVPAKRHPKMPAANGYIEIGGQRLMERPLFLTLQAQAEDLDRARALAAEAQKANDSSISNAAFLQAAQPIDEKEVAAARARLSEHQGRVYAEISLTIGVVLTDREIETAVSMRMDEKEYAKRKFLMRADVLQLINDHSHRDSNHVKVFDFVRLTTKDEWQ